MMKSSTLNKAPLIISGTMLGVILGLGTMLTSNIVSADNDSVVDQINITIPVSCTLEATGQNTHNAEINNGQYNSSIGETTMKTFCNDNNGFAIYAIGYTNNEEGNNVLTSPTLGSTYDIVTGTATSGGTSNWAMKLSVMSDPTPTYPLTIENSFDSFHDVPDDYILVAKRLSATDTGTNAEGSTLKSTYQVYINQTQPAGTYTGQVRYTLVHPNDASAPVKPIACNPNGTTIGTNTSTDIICMQDISSTNKSSIMSSMAEGTQYTLTDKRDEKAYTIAKLADDNIWMTQNLDLDLDSTKTYTNEDTDLGWDSPTNSYQTASWTPMRSTYETTITQTHEWCAGGTLSQNGYCNNNDTPESYDPGDIYWSGIVSDESDWYTYEGSCDFNNNPPSCDESLNPLSTYVATPDTPTPQYHLGNYYNWPAALAMNDTTPITSDGVRVEQSICPAGWTLPYANEIGSTQEGDFANLWNNYGWNNYRFDDSSTVWSTPTFFAPLGRFSGTIMVGSHSSFWSSGAGNSSRANHTFIDFTINTAYPGTKYFFNRHVGLSVRCLLR